MVDLITVLLIHNMHHFQKTHAPAPLLDSVKTDIYGFKYLRDSYFDYTHNLDHYFPFTDLVVFEVPDEK